jgi:hypothetical protein
MLAVKSLPIGQHVCRSRSMNCPKHLLKNVLQAPEIKE